MKKRFQLFQYNLKIKKQIGIYNPGVEQGMMESNRSLNLLDFSKFEDFYLLDQYSDASELGGESKCELTQIEDQENKDTFLRVTGKLQRESSNLLRIDYMFLGFKQFQMITSKYDYYNGVRIVMKPPMQPAKLGLVIQSTFREFEHYSGFLLDNNNPNPNQYQSYEIPINLMTNHNIRDRIMQNKYGGSFICKGLTFCVESTFETPFNSEIQIDIKKIDMIQKDEFETLLEDRKYTKPVFMKSPQMGLSFDQQGFIDNGREIIQYGQNYEMKQQQEQMRGKQTSINQMAYEDKLQQQQQQQNSKDQERIKQKTILEQLKEMEEQSGNVGSRSIKDRLREVK
eukprot:403338435